MNRVGQQAADHREREKRQHRQTGNQRQHAEHSREQGQGFRIEQKLAAQFAAQIVFRRGARHQNTGGDGGDQRGNLRDETVANGQQREALQGFAHGHALLHDADGETADDVDERDEDRRDGVAADKFAGPIHRAVKVRLLLDCAPAIASLGFIDQTGVEFGINRHLFAGHRVQGEARRDFRDAAGTLGDDDEIDENENQEDDHADDVIAAHDEVAECFNDVPRKTIEQNEPR